MSNAETVRHSNNGRVEGNGGTGHCKALEDWSLLKFKRYDKCKFHPEHDSPLACDATLSSSWITFPRDACKSLRFLSLSVS